jgi:hypothetical protein
VITSDNTVFRTTFSKSAFSKDQLECKGAFTFGTFYTELVFYTSSELYGTRFGDIKISSHKLVIL